MLVSASAQAPAYTPAAMQRGEPARRSASGEASEGAAGRARGVAGAANPGELSPEDRQLLARLQQRDREVRAHEMAHVAAGAGLVTRGASYTYQRGPDGQRYAIGGEVQIDTSPGRTPEETLAKAERIRAAAMAPADPSPQDHAVAAQAGRMAMEARLEIAAQADEARATDPAGAAARRAFAPGALAPSETGQLIDAYA